MIGIEPWIDLLAAALAGPRLAGPVAVLHEAQRVLPLLESRASVAWLHPHALAMQDFTLLPRCRPLFRERLDALGAPDDAADLLRRAGLRLLCVPDSPRHIRCLMGLTEHATAKESWLVYGDPQAAGWEAVGPLQQRAQLQELPGRGHLRWMASGPVVSALAALGLTSAGFTPELAQTLRQQLPRGLDLLLDLNTQSGRPRLRLRPEPVQFIAAAAPSLAHHVVMEGRALFNQRGLATLMLPWDGSAHTRLLLRNVRDRIDESEIALGEDTIQPSHLDYTERGAVLTLRLPAISLGRDARLQLSLPRRAVPDDGFCDIGAIEFMADLA